MTAMSANTRNEYETAVEEKYPANKWKSLIRGINARMWGCKCVIMDELSAERRNDVESRVQMKRGM
jgi:hypothetical protein